MSLLRNSVVPPGLESLFSRYPALKRWAKVDRPLRGWNEAALGDLIRAAVVLNLKGKSQSNPHPKFRKEREIWSGEPGEI